MPKRIVQLVLWTAIGIWMAGCAAHSSRKVIPTPQALVATPDTFTVPDPALPSQITLAWDDPDNADQGARSYYLYYWEASWNERKRVDTGTQTTYTLQNLEAGQLYSFAVTVHDGAGGRESMLSKEISHRIPATEHTDHRDRPSFTIIEAPGVLANDHGSDGNGLTAQLVSGPSNGSIQIVRFSKSLRV